MGSYNFLVTATKKEHSTAADAYKSLVEESLYEYGHNAYSGTIATTEHYTMFKDFPVTTEEELNRAEDIILGRTQKWDLCECVDFNDQWIFIGWAAS